MADIDNLTFSDGSTSTGNMEDLSFIDSLTFIEDDITSIVTQIDDKGLAILFTYIDDESSVVEAAITDNYVETNHSVQDHIAIKPRIYRLRGCVGEVVYKGSSEWLKWLGGKVNSNPILKKTLETMKPITAVSGIASSATQSAMAVVNQLESSYIRYKKMVENSFLKKQTAVTGKIQESTVADLNRILELRIPVNLKGLKFESTFTAGDDYERQYYLQSVSAHQGNNAFITDIEVTIKEFRVATTKVTKVDSKNTISMVKATQTNQGKVAAQESDVKLSDPSVTDQIIQKVGEPVKKAATYAAEAKTPGGKLTQWLFNAMTVNTMSTIKWLTGANK